MPPLDSQREYVSSEKICIINIVLSIFDAWTAIWHATMSAGNKSMAFYKYWHSLHIYYRDIGRCNCTCQKGKIHQKNGKEISLRFFRLIDVGHNVRRCFCPDHTHQLDRHMPIKGAAEDLTRRPTGSLVAHCLNLAFKAFIFSGGHCTQRAGRPFNTICMQASPQSGLQCTMSSSWPA